MIGAEIARLGLRRLNPIRHIEALLKPRPRTGFGRVAVLESSLYMRNQLLRDTDWASMAHSLEVRVPLVDIKLLSQLASITRQEWIAIQADACEQSARATSPEGHRTSEDRLHNSDPNVAAARQSHPGVAASSCACCREVRVGEALGLSGGGGQSGSVMARSWLRVLALVTDAFGGHGGIAQYNRDFLSALARCDRSRRGDRPAAPLRKIGGHLACWCSAAACRGKQTRIFACRALDGNDAPAIDLVFCGHLFMAPLAAVIAKVLQGSVVGPSPRDRSLAELSVLHRRSVESATMSYLGQPLYTTSPARVGRNRPGSGEGSSKHRGSTVSPGTKACLPARPPCCGRKEGADDGVPLGTARSDTRAMIG